jgi:hypothetical protein
VYERLGGQNFAEQLGYHGDLYLLEYSAICNSSIDQSCKTPESKRRRTKPNH